MFATLKNPTKQMLNISFWKLHAVKVKKANKKKCKTFFWQKKCCLLAVSFMSTSSTSSNSFFNFETNFHSVCFFNFVFFQLVFFSFKKTTKNVYKSSVFSVLLVPPSRRGRGRTWPWRARRAAAFWEPTASGRIREGGEENVKKKNVWKDVKMFS